jgi:flagellar basal body-associated protein FliL
LVGPPSWRILQDGFFLKGQKQKKRGGKGMDYFAVIMIVVGVVVLGGMFSIVLWQSRKK